MWEMLSDIYYDSLDGYIVLSVALSEVFKNGTDKLRTMSEEEVADDIFANLNSADNDDVRVRAARMAKILETINEENLPILLAFLQREVPSFEDPTGEDIPLINDGDKEGICPVCGGVVEYNGDLVRRYADGSSVTWTCPCCGASGESVYSDIFNYHKDVMDANDEPVEGRSH